MSIFWSETARRITPYVPGEQPQDKQYIKLNTNENPYPPSPFVIEAINRTNNSSLRLYPDPESISLRKSISNYFGVGTDEIFVGNGSDEILAFSFMAFFMPDKPVIYSDITYTFYEVYSALFRVQSTIIPLNEDFTIDKRPYCTDGAGIIIANPNAPTGILLPLEDIETLLRSNPNNVVIIDEAYIDFGGQSSVQLIKNYQNLLVIQTMSKSRSLAGLRVGFAIGSRELIEGLNRIKNSANSYPIDRLAAAGAEAAINDEDYFKHTRGMIIKTRSRIVPKLQDMGFTVLDSRANFIFLSHPKVYAMDLFSALRDDGILVRHFRRPRIDNFLRVTIGTDDEMDTFLEKIGLAVLQLSNRAKND